MIVCDMADNTCRDKFSFRNKGIDKGQRNLQDRLTVANVVSPSRVITPPPPPEKRSGTTDGRQHHVAWTSVPQERWEGELLVQGHIPLWLVSNFFFFYQHSYFSSSNNFYFIFQTEKIINNNTRVEDISGYLIVMFNFLIIKKINQFYTLKY
jgi:carlactone synthase/all-trans-10'-apo-beta-carotenal 13,14-cleaving dioxygenase